MVRLAARRGSGAVQGVSQDGATYEDGAQPGCRTVEQPGRWTLGGGGGAPVDAGILPGSAKDEPQAAAGQRRILPAW